MRPVRGAPVTVPLPLPPHARTWILAAEGGLVDDPRDPGGITKFGISKRAYPMLDIPNLTEDDAARIYERDYFTRAGCWMYRDALALAVFDAAVNQGVPTAVRLLQLSLGISADGQAGPLTSEAAAKADDREVLLAFVKRRWRRYRETKGAEVFLGGWTNRLFDLEAVCMELLPR